MSITNPSQWSDLVPLLVESESDRAECYRPVTASARPLKNRQDRHL